MRPSSLDSSARWTAAFRQTSRATATASAAAFRSGVFTVLRSVRLSFGVTPPSPRGLLTPALLAGIHSQVGVPGRDGVGHVELDRVLSVIVRHVGRPLRNEDALTGEIGRA